MRCREHALFHGPSRMITEGLPHIWLLKIPGYAIAANGIKRVLTPPHHPAAALNGLVE